MTEWTLFAARAVLLLAIAVLLLAPLVPLIRG